MNVSNGFYLNRLRGVSSYSQLLSLKRSKEAMPLRKMKKQMLYIAKTGNSSFCTYICDSADFIIHTWPNHTYMHACFIWQRLLCFKNSIKIWSYRRHWKFKTAVIYMFFTSVSKLLFTTVSDYSKICGWPKFLLCTSTSKEQMTLGNRELKLCP